MIKEDALKINSIYKVKTGNTFELFAEYSPNVKCFRRQDGELFFGREFIEYENGERVLDLEEF